MVWLQSFEHYDTVASFDPDTHALEERSRLELGDAQRKLGGAGYNGFHSKLRKNLMAVYGRHGRLFLVVGEKLLEMDPAEIIEVSGPRRARRLVVSRDGEEVFAVYYSLAGIPGPIPGDPTPFIGEEDFDIGLLASNISKNPERRALFTAR